ncbi:MAG: 2,5-diamino-6-(ribosylamino)-4(3H)-pyrimidinone 5'-phosphate reductase [Thermoplasmata archaeon]|nr:MAG: 2,5-diamino-6-(ribosylamino)-4(3H)-pyrimidinone 5'-phosphate reductase [Thermoplasmata archaeon]
MRPYVILNSAMSLDGKIATKTGDSAFSSQEDWVRVHKLRKEVDAVMVGINTVIKDNPRLTVRLVACEKQPTRIVVDSKGRIPLTARILEREAPTIIAVSERAPKRRLALLSKKAEIIVCGGSKVDLNCLLNKLFERGIRKILLEGGGTLNWGMLKEKLVDKVIVAISPVIVGGRNAITLVEGEGFGFVREGIKLKLLRYYKAGYNMILEYEVV